MNKSDETTLLNLYQFPRWSTTSNRPHSSLPSKSVNEMFKLGIENRNHTEFSSKSRLIRHNIYIPTDSRILSPPLLYQPTPTPDICSAVDQHSLVASIVPIPIKSSAFTIPIQTPSEENSFKNFPKQFHERRKITQERKRQKQLALKHAHADADHWFRLRQSLVELKRLATTEEILVDPTNSLFNCDGYSFDALKQAIKEQQQEQKKINQFKSESGLSSSMDTIRSFNIRSRTSLTVSRNSFSRHQLARQPTETYSRPTFEPLMVATKPLHPILFNGNNHSSKIKPRSSSRARISRNEKRILLNSSDLSNNDDLPISFTPSPLLQNPKEEDEDKEEESIKLPQLTNSDQRRTSLKSTIKLTSPVPRCRSANDNKHSLTLNKNYPRFILITDQEHRIESWYNQYPFIVSDELIQSFQTKSNKSTVSAYFIDEHQSPTNKTHLQGKPFHINNDWKKYDLIFISNNIYQDIMIYLQTIIKLSGKLIHIYQINHNEDLKTQVRCISKQLNQQILSHV